MRILLNKAFSVMLFAVIASLFAFSGCKKTSTSETKDSQPQTAETSEVSKDAKTKPKKASDPVTVPPKMYDAELKAVDGTTFKLSDYKGKVVLINLWATWCGYCIKEMPDLVKFSDEYKDKDVVVIGLDGDERETPEQVKAFITKHDIQYQIGWASDEVLQVLQPQGLPSSYIINREGKFTWAVSGLIPASRIRTKLEEALNN